VAEQFGGFFLFLEKKENEKGKEGIKARKTGV
jgi:hypothetical protein